MTAEELNGGPLSPGHLLARTLDQVSEINHKLGLVEQAITVHLTVHQVWSRVHKAAYGLLVAVVGSLSGLLATHWH